nr:glutamine-hydrolyzing GMP synthase [Trueperella bonasi]
MRPVLVIDDGSPNVQLVARLVRKAGYFSELAPAAWSKERLLERDPQAVVVPRGATGVVEGLDAPVLEMDWQASEFDSATIEEFLAVAGLEKNWSARGVIDDQIAKIRTQVGDKRAIVGLSGGVDSSVAAALVHEAIGDQLTAVFVDHGLLRKGEAEQVVRDYAGARGMRILAIDESERFLSALEGVSDPEEKRKIIGREFIRSFEAAQRQLLEEAGTEGADIKFLVQGTVYPDVIESLAADGGVSVKSHHNVGGLPEDLDFELVEPLRDLFKDEVRVIGEELGLDAKLVWRQPFPGPGLGIRIIGAVDRERLDLLREADAIVREELSAAGLDREIWQCPVVLLADVRSVGVSESGRTYGHPIVLRPVQSQDAMSAQWTRIDYDLLARISERIIAEVDGVNRVVLDVTAKPPGTIEWE